MVIILVVLWGGIMDTIYMDYFPRMVEEVIILLKSFEKNDAINYIKQSIK